MTEEHETSLLRPYLMTAGRAQPVDRTLEIEAQVLTSPAGEAAHPDLAFEPREIVSFCRSTRSVAEVAAALGLHIGVARVLVADLAERGHVVIGRPANDLDTIERVIRGLEAIQ